MHQRRASAASAAIAQQRKINSDLVTNNGELQLNMMKPLQITQPHFTLTKLSTQQHRPQASVIPFQVISFFLIFILKEINYSFLQIILLHQI